MVRYFGWMARRMLAASLPAQIATVATAAAVSIAGVGAIQSNHVGPVAVQTQPGPAGGGSTGDGTSPPSTIRSRPPVDARGTAESSAAVYGCLGCS